VREVVEGDGDLDHPLERLPRVAGGRSPHRLEDLVHLEEEVLVPQRHRMPDRPRERVRARGAVAECGHGAGCAPGVITDPGGVRRVQREQGARAGIDQMDARETSGDGRCGVAFARREPGERCGSAIVLERSDGELGQGVAQRERQGRSVHESPDAPGAALAPRHVRCYLRGVVPHVYTAEVTVRHHELDTFGRVHPAVYLRYLAHAAVEASAAAGFDAAWYAATGTLWLVRRSTLDVRRPVRAGERLLVSTWVEDFRRVRSHRRYELVGTDGLCVDARTDWVYVDAESLRPRRVPAELEKAFGLRAALEREAWQAPPSPAAPGCTSHRVQLHELDSLSHVNNAAYLDIAAQAVFDVLEEAGWPFDRLIGSGAVPVLTRGDLEYLDAARYGERLDIQTWFSVTPPALLAHQHICRDGRLLVRANTRWGWAAPAGDGGPGPPGGLLPALRPLVVA